jgi:hypothetical protein
MNSKGFLSAPLLVVIALIAALAIGVAVYFNLHTSTQIGEMFARGKLKDY